MSKRGLPAKVRHRMVFDRYLKELSRSYGVSMDVLWPSVSKWAPLAHARMSTEVSVWGGSSLDGVEGNLL